MVCCFDAFDPIPDEPETQPNNLGKQGGETAAPIETLESKTADESESDNNEVGEDEDDDELEENEDLEEILVSVTLPQGVVPGQKIEVRSPDGRRTVDTVVPKGLKAGQTFIVRFPPTPSEPVTLQSLPVNEKEVMSPEGTNEKPLAVEPPKDQPSSPTNIPEPKSFMDILEDLITPDPDPDVQLFMKQEQEKLEQERRAQEASKAATRPMAEGVLVKTPLSSSPAKAKKTKARRMKAFRSPRNVETREDLDGDDSDVKEEAEESEDSGLEQLPSPKGKRPDRLSLVRSLEDFLTPVPDSRQDEPDSPKNLASPTPAARGTRYSPRGAAGGRSPYSPTDRQMAQRQGPAPYHNRAYTPTVGQKLLQVQVPPGLAPGSTIFVEIPGENRTVAAQVPPNVSSFHVAYVPQTYGTRVPPPTQARAVVVPKLQAGREKLLSVRVPPGTPPGTTLHVSVPDEPGRILAAQVPPGNVSKFHVSYIPSEHVMPHRSMLPPANAYQQPPSPSHPYGSRDPPIMNHSSGGWGGGGDSYGGAGGGSDVRDYPSHRESWEGYDF